MSSRINVDALGELLPASRTVSGKFRRDELLERSVLNCPRGGYSVSAELNSSPGLTYPLDFCVRGVQFHCNIHSMLDQCDFSCA